MLKALHLKNFRGFCDMRIAPLNKVNVITGKNDTGKTSLLEALYLLLISDPTQPLGNLATTFRNSQGNQSDDFKSFWEWLFFENNTALKPSIHAEANEGEGFFAQLSRAESGDIQIDVGYSPHRFQDKFSVGPGGYGGSKINRPGVLVQSTRLGKPVDDAELFNRVSLTAGGEEKILELMRIVEPRLQKLRYSKITSQPLVYAHLGFQHFLPATQMGQGFSRLLTLFCEMLVSKATVLLIDEIENGLHHSVLTEVWKGISALAELENIQVFATTHSEECLLAAHKAFQNQSTYDLAVIQLFRSEKGAQGRVLDREHIEAGIEAEIELR